MGSRSFEDLVVWQKAHEFVLAAYRMTQSFPRSEVYGLASQFRRAAVSIAANIAEGFRKAWNGRQDAFLQYRGRFDGGMSVLFDFGARSWLCRRVLRNAVAG